MTGWTMTYDHEISCLPIHESMKSSSTRLAVLSRLTAPVYAPLRRWVLRVIATPQQGVDYDTPLDDPGLFGPDSITWRLHADFPGMMAGGICALMLQTLHPRALAGVWDHSDFRRDTLGRLRSTTAFVAATTYAPNGEAQRLIDRVNMIHRRIHGETADGRAYSAQDSDLLIWVHCTEMWSFVQGYQRYRGITLPEAVLDRYFDETRRIAEALGARNVPGSNVEVEDYFRSVQPQLEFNERTAEVLDVLAHIRLPIPVAGLARKTFLGAGAALLPPWARGLLRRNRVQRLRDLAAARSLRTLAPLFRAALRNGVAARSCRRVGIAPETLDNWR